MNRRLGPLALALAVTAGGPAAASAATDPPRHDPQSCVKVIVDDVTVPLDDSDCDGNRTS